MTLFQFIIFMLVYCISYLLPEVFVYFYEKFTE